MSDLDNAKFLIAKLIVLIDSHGHIPPQFEYLYDIQDRLEVITKRDTPLVDIFPKHDPNSELTLIGEALKTLWEDSKQDLVDILSVLPEPFLYELFNMISNFPIKDEILEAVKKKKGPDIDI